MNMQVVPAVAEKSTPAWAVVRSRPKMEIAASVELNKAGMTAYCPVYRWEHKDRRSKKWIVRNFPLFVGWLFLRADYIDWYKLARCKSVSQVLTSPDSNPLTVSSETVEEIQHRTLSGEWDKRRVDGAMVQPGMKVAIEGNLSALNAVVASVKNERAVGLIVQMFGREVSAQISVEQLLRKG